LFERKGKCPGIFGQNLLYLLILYSNMSFEKAVKLSEKMRLSKEYKSEILKFIEAKDIILSNLSGILIYPIMMFIMS